MADMQTIYVRINWENSPSSATALGATNLNKIDLALSTIDGRVVTINTTKLDVATANTMVQNVTVDANGVFTITKLDGTTTTYDTKIEKIAVNFAYDIETQRLVLTLEDGTKQYVDLSSLVTDLDFTDSDTIDFTVTNGVVSAIVKNGSITGEKLQPNYLADVTVQSQNASNSASSALDSKNESTTQATKSQSYAVGGTGTRTGEDTDNAKYYKEQAKQIAGITTILNDTTASANQTYSSSKIEERLNNDLQNQIKTCTGSFISETTANGGIIIDKIGGTGKSEFDIVCTSDVEDTDGIYGVEVDVVNKTFTRIASSVGKTGGIDHDNINAYGGRRRCNITDDGVVTAYYGESAYTETGALTQAVTINETTYPIGTIVQVMVEQPKFYYKVFPMQIETVEGGKGYHLRKARYYISDEKKEGFKLHPAFIQNGTQRDFIYLSAYDGSTFDVSESSYNTTDAQTVDFSNDKLSSIANAKPTSGLTQGGATRAGFRTIAANRGAGWSQETVQSATATEILFLVEYASFDMQSKIGVGVTNKTDDGTTSMTEITGATTTLGNKTGAVVNTNGWTVVSYRGQENPFGNIWKLIDGINVYNYGEGSVYIADHNFADNIGSDPYQDAGITIAGTNGYVSAFAYNEDFDWLFIASETVGNDKLPVGDYFYQNKATSAWTVALLGGHWYSGAYAGGFYWLVDAASSYRNRTIGGRLLYVPGLGESIDIGNNDKVTIVLDNTLETDDYIYRLNDRYVICADGNETVLDVNNTNKLFSLRTNGGVTNIFADSELNPSLTASVPVTNVAGVALENYCKIVRPNKKYTASIPSTGWTGTTAPHTIDITVTGLTADDKTQTRVVYTGTSATDLAIKKNWSKIYRIVPGANKITVYATNIPSAAIPIEIEVI